MAKQQKQAKTQTSSTQAKATGSGKTNRAQKTDLEFPLAKENFILMAVGFAIIILGYILMSGDENIYNFTKRTLSVIVVMFGYIMEIYAIMKTPKSQQNNQPPE